jgi:hypothetical protein
MIILVFFVAWEFLVEVLLGDPQIVILLRYDVMLVFTKKLSQLVQQVLLDSHLPCFEVKKVHKILIRRFLYLQSFVDQL